METRQNSTMPSDSEDIRIHILRNPRSILRFAVSRWTDELISLALDMDATLLYSLEAFPLSAQVRISIIRKKPQLITQLSNPTLTEKLAAVQIDGMMLGSIIDPTLSVELAAVRQNPAAIQFVHNPSVDFLQKAISANEKVLYYLADPPEEIISYALNLNGLNIRYLSPLTETRQMMMKALASPQRVDVIQYFNDTYGQLCWFARHFQDAVNDAKQLGMNLEHINSLLTATLKGKVLEFPDSKLYNPWNTCKQYIQRSSLHLEINTQTGHLELDGLPVRDFFNSIPGMECDADEYNLYQYKNRLEAQ